MKKEVLGTVVDRTGPSNESTNYPVVYEVHILCRLRR